MDVRRVRVWEWLTGLAGLVLLVSLFLPWYSAGDPSVTGWEAFSVIDVILALAAVSAIALPVVAAGQRTAAVPQAMASSIIWILLVAAVLAVIRLINPPGVEGGIEGSYLNTATGYSAYASLSADVSRDAGVWIAAVAALALVAFDIKSMRDKRFPAAMRPRLDIETVPAPAADGSRRDVR